MDPGVLAPREHRVAGQLGSVVADPVLPAQIGHLHACPMLTQHAYDPIFGNRFTGSLVFIWRAIVPMV